VIFCSGGACRQTVIQAQAERSFQREKARVRHTTKLSGRLAEEECWNVIFGSGFIQPLYYYFGLCLPINVTTTRGISLTPANLFSLCRLPTRTKETVPFNEVEGDSDTSATVRRTTAQDSAHKHLCFIGQGCCCLAS